MKFVTTFMAVVLMALALGFVQYADADKLNNQPPKRGKKNIFFLESTCASCPSCSFKNHPLHLGLQLKHRQVCSIESAARAHPNSSVYLFYTCPFDKNSLNLSRNYVQRVFQMQNVHVWQESMSHFFHGTPLENLYKSGRIQSESAILQIVHTSDVLRIMLLRKYGGIYLDLDFIVRRSLDSLGANFICVEESHLLGNAVIGLSAGGVGEEIASLYVNELRTNFRTGIWGYNGPGVATRVMEKYCGVKQFHLTSKTPCGGFEVLPQVAFYPLRPEKWLLMYNESQANVTMSTQLLLPSYSIHLWNSKILGEGYGEDDNKLIHLGSKQPILQLQQEYCPIVYSEY